MEIRIEQRSTRDKTSEKKNILDREVSFSLPVGDKEKERLYAELRTLLEAGMDFRISLEMLIPQFKKKAQVELKKVWEGLMQGISLSEAFKKSKVFTEYETQSIAIGEESGKLSAVFQELADFYARKIELKRSMIKIFSYPIFVVAVSLGVIYFMLSYVVPLFEDVFKRFDAELPMVTRFVMASSDWLGRYGLTIFLSIIGVSIFIYLNRKSTWVRSGSANLLMKVPFIGKLVHKVYLARFSQMMSLLLHSDVPILRSLELVQKVIGFYPIEQAIIKMLPEMRKGKSFHLCLGEQKVFEDRITTMIRIGEEVRQMESMFTRLAVKYNDEVSYQSSVMGSVLEPALLVVVAMFVGIIMIAMYLPLFQMSQLF